VSAPGIAGWPSRAALLLVPQSGRSFWVIMGLEYLAAILAYLVVRPGNLVGMLDRGGSTFVLWFTFRASGWCSVIPRFPKSRTQPGARRNGSGIIY
jgi:hypothetical protein